MWPLVDFCHQWLTPFFQALMDLAQSLGEALTEEEINRLPTSVFMSSNASTSSTNHSTCTICMDEFVDEEVQRHLPCLHTFHKKCIDIWLKVSEVFFGSSEVLDDVTEFRLVNRQWSNFVSSKALRMRLWIQNLGLVDDGVRKE